MRASPSAFSVRAWPSVPRRRNGFMYQYANYFRLTDTASDPQYRDLYTVKGVRLLLSSRGVGKKVRLRPCRRMHVAALSPPPGRVRAQREIRSTLPPSSLHPPSILPPPPTSAFSG